MDEKMLKREVLIVSQTSKNITVVYQACAYNLN